MIKNNNNLPMIESIDIENRFEPFPLITLQQSYLIGRSNKVELGGVSSQAYYEVNFENLDIQRFKQTWYALVKRHDMLRTCFNDNNQQQFIPYDEAYEIEFNDFSKLDEESLETKLLAIRKRIEDGALPLVGPLVHVQVSQLNETEFRVHFAIDMLIGDLSCLFILYREFGQLYADPEAQLEPLDLSFRDYVKAYERLEQYDDYQKAKKYWLDRLADFPNAPDLPLNPVAMPRGGQKTSRHQFILSPDTWHSLKRNAKQYRVTPTILLLTAFAQVLSLWSKNKRFALNVTLMNRLPLHEQVISLLGEFTSTVLLEVDTSEPADFAKRAMQIRQQLKSDMDNKLYSGIEFLREIVKEKGAYNEAVMGVVFTSYLHFANQIRDQGAWDIDKVLSTKQLGYNATRTTQVALDHQVCELQDGSALLWWDTIDSIFPEGMLDDMIVSYEKLLHALADDSSQALPNLLPVAQQKKRHEVNNISYPISEELLHSGFVKQAAKTPDAIALIHDDLEISYAQLDRWTDALAAQIRAKGAKPNELVAIVGFKGWEQIVASIAILKSGAAYMPLDANLPMRRLEFLVEQSDCKIAISSVRCKEITDQLDSIFVFTLEPQWLESLHSEPLETVQAVTDIAYVIFTSGSTGTPKGVIIDHRGALNTCDDINRRFNIDHTDSVLALSSLSFDLSVYDIFGMLSAGGRLIIPDEADIKNLEKWWELVDKFKITVWNTVPLLMQLMVDYCEKINMNCLTQLKLVMMSGDWIPVKLPDRIREFSSPENQIVSLGGATEASIWSIFYVIDKPTAELRSIPYGKPLTNQSFHVLDENMKDCPDWAVGQLYIGGIGVAKGYWKDKAKTEASFITMENDEVLYRTGDLGRYIADGNIEIMGREDNQIKIQGYRVELGEIEKSINEHPMVSVCVVDAVGDKKGRKSLVGYVVYRQSVSHSGTGQCFDIDMQGCIECPTERSVFQLAQHSIRNIEGAESIELKSDLMTVSNDLTQSKLAVLLSDLRQHSFDGHSLPKYAYGSASSLYPVQLYVYISKQLGDLVTGSYYYYPVNNSLVKLAQENIVEPDMKAPDSPIRAYYVADMSAVKPMYPHDLATKLVQLEAGYMSEVIHQKAKELNVSIKGIWAVNEVLIDKPQLPADALWIGSADIGVPDCGESTVSAVSLDECLLDEQVIKLPKVTSESKPYSALQRQSFRSFSGEPVGLKALSAVLGDIGDRSGMTCVIYAKAGGVEGLDKNLYQYDAERHLLQPLLNQGEGFEFVSLYSQNNAAVYHGANFVILLLARKQSSAVEYLRQLIDCGRLGQQIMSKSWQNLIGLCPIGIFDENKLFKHLSFKDEFVVVHQFIGGAIEESQLMNWQVSGKSSQRLAPPSDEELVTFLGERLPIYMVPRLFMVLDNLPMTATGKVDRKSLPKVDFDKMESDNYQAPSTAMEKAMANLWQNLLEVERVGVNDNFFILGGNSVLAMKVIAVLRAEFKLDIGLARLFESPTIAGMLSHVAADKSTSCDDRLDFDNIRDSYLNEFPEHSLADYQLFPTTYSQKQLFAFEQLTEKQSAYNILMQLQINGEFDVTVLKRSLTQLVQRHEALRTSFVYQNGQLMQRVMKNADIELPRITLSEFFGQDKDEQLKQELKSEAAEPFNLEEKVVRFKLFKQHDKLHTLTINVHHIVADFISMEILKRDIIGLFEAASSGKESILCKVESQFADFALWQNQFLQTNAAKKQLTFWKENLYNRPATTLPDEKLKGGFNSNVGKFLGFSMPDGLQGQLQKMCKEQDVTMFMVGMTAIAQMISNHTGQREIPIGTPISTRHFDKLEPVMGMMLNTLVVRVECNGHETGIDLLRSVKENCLKAFENKELPYEHVIENLKKDGVKDTDSIYRIRYVYRNVHHQEGLEKRKMVFKEMQMDKSDAKFDLLVNLNDSQSSIDGVLEYKSDLWFDKTIGTMSEQLCKIMEWFATSPQNPLSELQQLLATIKIKRMMDSAKDSKHNRANKLKALI